MWPYPQKFINVRVRTWHFFIYSVECEYLFTVKKRNVNRTEFGNLVYRKRNTTQPLITKV